MRYIDLGSRKNEAQFVANTVRVMDRVHAFSPQLLSLFNDPKSEVEVTCQRCGLSISRNDDQEAFRVKYLGRGRPLIVAAVLLFDSNFPCSR